MYSLSIYSQCIKWSIPYKLYDMGPSAIFDRMKDEEFIKEEILPNFTDCFLKNERYVLLLSQFITMKDRLSLTLSD